MTDLLNPPTSEIPIAETVVSATDLRPAVGWYLSTTGDLWELTDEGWYVNGNWAGRVESTIVPDMLQRLLTCDQWMSRVRKVVQQAPGHALSTESELILAETKREELFPDDEEQFADADVRSQLLDGDIVFPTFEPVEEAYVPLQPAVAAPVLPDVEPEPARRRGLFRRG